MVIRDEEQEARFLVERGARVAINGKFYELVGDKIDRRRINDWPDPIPSSGKRDLDTRALQQALHIRDIRNDFAGEHVSVGGDVATHFEHGHIHDLADAQADTRFGRMYPPRNENNPSIVPGASGDADVAGDGSGSANKNSRAAAFFSGTTNKGLFTWYEITGLSPISAAIFWNGTAWVDAGDINTSAEKIYDVIVHQSRLMYLAAGNVYISTTGAPTGSPSVFGTMAQEPFAGVTPKAGSKLLSDGNLLWCFSQDQSAAGAFEIANVAGDGSGGTAWDTRLTGQTGQIRDVGFFFDRGGNSQIFVLTEAKLYWLDATNYALVKLRDLPFGGRAMSQIGDTMMVVMDGFNVLLYSESGAIQNVTPILPTPYDFDTDSGSGVAIFDGLSGPIVMYGGATKASGDAVLIAQFIIKQSGAGFHYIWHEATNVQGGHAGKFIYVDPVSGDLLGAINSTSGNTDLSTGLQFKDIEEDPSLMATLDVRTTGHIRSQRMNMGSSEVTKTFLTTGIESQKVDSTETITPEYRIDGATSAFGGSASALPAIILENARVSFPGPSSSSTEGVSAVNLQIQYAFASGGVTLGAFIDEFVLTYLPIPTKRYVYTFTVRILEGQSDQEPAGTLADLDTLEDTKIKVDFIYGGRSAVEVLPISQTRMLETIVDTDNEVTARREAEVTLVLAEI